MSGTRSEGNGDVGRLTHLRREQMDPDQRALYDDITTGPRATGPQLFSLTDADGGLQGPFEGMLRAPALGAALQGLGSAVRYDTALSPRVREMAILAVAAGWDSAFERYAHEAVARHVGVDEDELAQLRDGDVPSVDDDDEQVALAAVVSLVRHGDLTDAEYAAVVARLGERGVVELTTLIGYYATLALQLRVFRVGVPDRS